MNHHHFNLPFIFCCLCSVLIAQDDEQYLWDNNDSGAIDTVIFEAEDPLISIDTLSTNLWQIGNPQKVLLDSAFSPSKVIITDTLGPYPVDNHSFFDFYLNETNLLWYYENIFVGFYHKIDTDTLRDGGYLEISFNGGDDFYNVLEYPEDVYFEGYPIDEDNGLNLYGLSDTLYTGEPGFSGTSTDWTLTMFGWYVVYPKPPKPHTDLGDSAYAKDTEDEETILRFHFISDSIDTQREGWMIDDIFTFWVDFPGSTKNEEAIAFQLFPNPANKELSLLTEKVFGHLTVEISDMTGKKIMTRVLKSADRVKLTGIDLNTGFYLVSLIGDDRYLGTARLVIRR